jgi:hypothetical protein
VSLPEYHPTLWCKTSHPTLSHYRRPKLYQSTQGWHVNLARAHKVWCPRRVYVTSSVGNNLGWHNTELALWIQRLWMLRFKNLRRFEILNCGQMCMLCVPKVSRSIKSKDPRLRIDAYTVADSAVVTVTTSAHLICPCKVSSGPPSVMTDHHGHRWRVAGESRRMVTYSTNKKDRETIKSQTAEHTNTTNLNGRNEPATKYKSRRSLRSAVCRVEEYCLHTNGQKAKRRKIKHQTPIDVSIGVFENPEQHFEKTMMNDVRCCWDLWAVGGQGSYRSKVKSATEIRLIESI